MRSATMTPVKANTEEPEQAGTPSTSVHPGRAWAGGCAPSKLKTKQIFKRVDNYWDGYEQYTPTRTKGQTRMALM